MILLHSTSFCKVDVFSRGFRSGQSAKMNGKCQGSIGNSIEAEVFAYPQTKGTFSVFDQRVKVYITYIYIYIWNLTLEL